MSLIGKEGKAGGAESHGQLDVQTTTGIEQLECEERLTKSIGS